MMITRSRKDVSITIWILWQICTHHILIIGFTWVCLMANAKTRHSCILFSLVNSLNGTRNSTKNEYHDVRFLKRTKLYLLNYDFFFFLFLNITDNRRNLYSRRSPTITLQFTIAIIITTIKRPEVLRMVPRSTGHDKVIMKK